MIKRAKFDCVWFVDAIGERREIRGLPLSRRRRFTDLQELAGAIVLENPDCSIGFLYDHDDDFSAAIDEALTLYSLSADWCSASQVMQLFFAYEGGPGLCWQLEFPETDKPAKGRLLNPETDPYHASIAALWSYTPDLSLAEVIASIGTTPWIDVEGILDERNRQAEEADPELKKKREEEAQMESLKQSIENLDFSTFGAGL